MTATRTPQNWRNIGIIAHIDAGKTTLTERILLKTGEIHRAGEVHNGQTTMDHTDLERERGITITAAATQCEWSSAEVAPHRLTIIDTPGHIDFSIEVERSLRVLDGAVAVFCAVGGVQPQSETVWRQARRHKVPVIAFINKMDRIGADFERVLGQLREKLGAKAVPVAWPLGAENAFEGTHDLVGRKTWTWTAEGVATVAAWDDAAAAGLEARRQELVEAVAEFDDELMEAFAMGQDASAEAIRRALRRGALEGAVVPVLAGSAFKNKGVETLLDAVAHYLPSPMDRAAVPAQSESGEQMAAPDAEAPLAGLVFKVVAQEHGTLAFVRLYSGRLSIGQTVWNSGKGSTARVGRLCVVKADETEDVSSAQAGEIVAIMGWKDAATGETLCAENHRWALESIQAQAPVLAWTLSAQSQSDLARMGTGLARLAQEDPSFKVTSDPETGETIAWGMGELHLDVMVERLRREFGVETRRGTPRVAYQEILAGATGPVEGKLAKQTGGKGQFARVVMEFAPRDDGLVVFEDRVKGGVVPRGFIPAVEKGVRLACAQGPHGHPVVGLTATLVDGEAHAVDSSEMAFQKAGSLALAAAFEARGTVVLEPVMRVKVDGPAHAVGDVIADAQRRQGRLLGVEEESGGARIEALVPLSQLGGYATALRSLTQGRASAAMELESYEPVAISAPNLRRKAAP